VVYEKYSLTEEKLPYPHENGNE